MRKTKNVLVFTTWSFKDGLIQAATIPYLRIISEITGGTIYLICLEQPGLQLTDEEAQTAARELSAFRIRLIRFNYRKNKLRAAFDWGFRIIYLIALTHFRRISYLHPFCTPAASLAWIVSKFKKTKLIVDSFEPHAEVMVETGTWHRSGKLFRFVFALEKKLVKSADVILAVSKHIATYIKEHYHTEPPAGKILYRPLCVNPVLFTKTPPDYGRIGWTKKEKAVIGIYTGKTGGMYYEEELCVFIRECIRFWNGDFHFIMCTSMDKEKTEQFLVSGGIEKHFFTVTFANHGDVPAYLSLADFGISFSRPSAARQYGCPTKNAEYWSMGLPVIATDAIWDDTVNITANPYLGIVIKDINSEGLNTEIAALDNLIQHRHENETRIRAFAIHERSFDTVRGAYQHAYT